MILYKQITYININETTYKLAEKYTISRTHDVKKHYVQTMNFINKQIYV